MVAEVARVFARTEEGCGAALIEAGTGTGKTLAYLLPGVVLAHAQKKKLVIATATVAPVSYTHLTLPTNREV